jgi:hypothetical protein
MRVPLWLFVFRLGVPSSVTPPLPVGNTYTLSGSDLLTYARTKPFDPSTPGASVPARACRWNERRDLKLTITETHADVGNALPLVDGLGYVLPSRAATHHTRVSALARSFQGRCYYYLRGSLPRKRLRVSPVPRPPPRSKRSVPPRVRA